MAQDIWIDSTGAIVANPSTAGRYMLRENVLDSSKFVSLGARASGGGEFTVQFFAEAAGATKTLGPVKTVVDGTPVIWDEEYSLIGNRGIDVVVTTPGTLEVLVLQ